MAAAAAVFDGPAVLKTKGDFKVIVPFQSIDFPNERFNFFALVTSPGLCNRLG